MSVFEESFTTTVTHRREARSETAAGGAAPGLAAAAVKRAVDIVLGSLLLILSLPLVLLLVVGVAISLRANPFFVQDRVGRGGTTLRFIKLRTLPPQTPKYTDKYALAEVEIPAFCRLLRRLHLDELPQLTQVVLGRMSLVGPRPELPPLHDKMHPVHASTRISVRPGCTGLWQVSTAAEGLIREAPEYDLFYVHHRSLRLDTWIIWRTALTCIGLGSELDLSSVPQWAMRQNGDEPHVWIDRASDLPTDQFA